jgi:hypothetical protein
MIFIEKPQVAHRPPNAAGRAFTEAAREGVPFLDDVSGDLRRGDVAAIPGGVNGPGGNEQDPACLHRHGRVVPDLVLERAFEDIDDFFARMRVLREPHSGREFDSHLDNLASEALRSCRWRSIRFKPGCCARDGCIAAPLAQVGGELGASEITVKAHRRLMMRKMKAGSLPDVVTMAARLGLRAATTH